MSRLAAQLARQQLEALANGEAIEDVVASYELQIAELAKELAAAHRDAGDWQLRAQTAEKDARRLIAKCERQEQELAQLRGGYSSIAEVERLKNQIAGMKRANDRLNLRCHGKQPIEVAR